MSLWRAKRRQTITRRFRERADATLLAIHTLEAEADNLQVESDPDETRRRLREGAEFLDELQAAIESPANADDHLYALARSLMDRWEMLENRSQNRLEADSQALNRAADDLKYDESLEQAKQTLKDIERISADASESEESKLRKHFAH